MAATNVQAFSGSVGIGTDTPVGVNGGQRLEGSSSTGFEYIATRDDTTTEADDFIGAYLFKNTDTEGNAPHYAGMSSKATGGNGPMNLRFHANRDKYETDAVPDMTINSTGRVGIGRTDPSGKLHITGGTTVGSVTDIYIGDDANVDTSSIISYKKGDNGSNPGRLTFGHYGDDFINGTSTMCIKKGGRVGIGRTDPTGKLHITGGTTVGSVTDLYIGDGANSDTTSIISYKKGDNGSNPGRLTFGHYGDDFINGTSTMCIKKGGNVGIGTTNPKQLLDVGINGYGVISGRLGVGNVLTSAQSGNQDHWDLGTSAKLVVRTPQGSNPSVSYANARTYAGIAFVPEFDALDTTNMGLWGSGSGENPAFYIQGQVNNGANGGGRIALQPVAGSVGIGSTTPTGQLEVHGTGQTSFTSFNQAGNMGGALALRSDDGISGSGGAVMFGSNSGFHAAIKASLVNGDNNTTGDLNFFVRSDHPDATMSQKMVIKNNGRVGIGTTNPGSLLHIKSPIENGATFSIASNQAGQSEYSTTFLQKGSSTSDRHLQIQTVPYPGSNYVAKWLMLNQAGNGWTTPFVMNGEGRLGIGTDAYANTARMDVRAVGTGGDTSQWIASTFGGTGNYNRVVVGTVSGKPAVAAHNSTLTAWAHLYLGDPTNQHIIAGSAVGIGTAAPVTKLGVKTAAAVAPGADWSHNEFMVGRHGPNTNTQSLGVAIGTDHGNDGNSKGTIWCMRPGQTWNALKLLGNYVELSAVTTNGVILSGGTVVTSDDRLKTDEVLIKNATSTLMKLKPQTYNKHKNLPNSKDESQIDNAGIPYNKSGMEAGLMVQDVYYDAPELKHLVLLSDDAIPRETKPEEPVPGDLQQDPDYSDWGVKPSNLNYTGLTPYIIKSIQETNTELPRHKTKIDGIPFSNISAYHNLIVSKDSVVRLSNTYNDKTVYGVISETEASTDDSEVLVNYQGDGKVWVINTSNIEAGDYITTSNVGGYGMKQGTDYTMNYTLAKSTITCDFTQPHIAEKRKIQELQDVTYWSVTQNIDISKKRYDFIASNNVNLVTTTTEIHYSNVSVEELTGNTVYSNITTQEYSSLESDEQNNYTEVSETKYHLISTREYSLDPRNKTSNVIVRQEYVDVLDGNGQFQWEDTGNTVPMYELRYLNSDGIQTDEANAVYKAALIECTFKTG
jgi:hypothetical protein